MKNSNLFEEPRLIKIDENEWEFVFPKHYDDDEIFNLFENGFETLDIDDLKSEHYFKKIIEKCPYHIDAFNHLSVAYKNQDKNLEALLATEKAYNTGMHCFPKEFNFKKDKIEWSNLDNRPFLRACIGIALQYYDNKELEKTINVLSDMLKFNQNDHQGVRYLLLEIYFKINKLSDIDKLLKKYKDDFSIEFTFGTVSFSILNDDISKADKLLGKAIETNQFFIEEVNKKRHIKPKSSEIQGVVYTDYGIPCNSIREAFNYWEKNKELYSNPKILAYFSTKTTTNNK